MSSIPVKPIAEALLNDLRRVLGPELSPEIEEKQNALRGLAERLDSHRRNLTFVAVSGPTGSGKSKITNSIFRKVLSPVGYKRPTTCVPYVVAPHGQAEAIASSLRSLPFELVELDDSSSLPLVLIDTPDIDSLRLENRNLAEAFIRFSDALLFVVDPEKYGDRSVWKQLESFRDLNVTFAAVLNRVRDPSVESDFREKLQKEGIQTEVFTVPYYCVTDNELLPHGPWLDQVRSKLLSWARSPHLRERALLRSAKEAANIVEKVFLPPLKEKLRLLEDCIAEVKKKTQEKARYMREEMAFSIDRKTALSLYSKLLSELERVDPLRLPRRILTAPFRYLRDRLGLGVRQSAESPELSRVSELREEAFVEAVCQLVVASEEAMKEAGVTQTAAAEEKEIREMWRGFNQKFYERTKKEAQAVAQNLAPARHFKFYVCQALVLGAFFGLELQTGGVLTLTEVITGGLLSPFASKLVGMALSAEESHRFYKRMRDFYFQGVEELLEGLSEDILKPLREQVQTARKAHESAEKLLAVLKETQS